MLHIQPCGPEKEESASAWPQLRQTLRLCLTPLFVTIIIFIGTLRLPFFAAFPRDLDEFFLFCAEAPGPSLFSRRESARAASCRAKAAERCAGRMAAINHILLRILRFVVPGTEPRRPNIAPREQIGLTFYVRHQNGISSTSALFAATDRSRRWSGLTQQRVLHLWSISFPAASRRRKIKTEIRCAQCIAPLYQKAPYPSESVAAVQRQQPESGSTSTFARNRTITAGSGR